jgi:hypothetical protein
LHLHNQPGKRLNHRARSTNNSDSLDEAITSDPSRRMSGVQARAERTPSVPPASELSAARPLVSIGSPVDAALLEPTYAYLSVYAFACFAPRVAERLNVAIYELLSNALHYGAPTGEVRLELERAPGARGARLRVSNDVEPEQLQRLTAQLGRVLADPAAAFTTEMNRFAGASQPPPMLGLVRVAHETGLTLELRVDGGRVELSTLCDA